MAVEQVKGLSEAYHMHETVLTIQRTAWPSSVTSKRSDLSQCMCN